MCRITTPNPQLCCSSDELELWEPGPHTDSQLGVLQGSGSSSGGLQEFG